MQYESRLCFVVNIIKQSILIPPTRSMINIAGLILSSALTLPFNISMSLYRSFWGPAKKFCWMLLTEAYSQGFYYKELDS